MQRVLIVQAQMKQYRVPFFVKLYTALQASDVQLCVAYSSPAGPEVTRGDNADLPDPIGLKVRGYWLCGNRLLYQPLLREIHDADLVIVEQATKHLLNPILLGMSRLKCKKVAFWGHGRNRQGNVNIFAEKVKRRTVGWVDHWFAYTTGVRDYVVSLGVPAQRVTSVNNSIDMTEFHRLLADATADQIQATRRELSLDNREVVGLYCGGLYPDKHLDFLIDAANLVHSRIPEFRLVVIGGGPEFPKIKTAMEKCRWITGLGPRFGIEKATLFKLASVFLMPGLVGLAILDAFAAGLPVITTDVPIHSPEVEYLEDNVNGYMVRRDLGVYSDVVVSVLQNSTLLNRLRHAAIRSGSRYSLEGMVELFHSGIVTSLNCAN